MTSRVLNKGFTLIELALVAATIGVLMVSAAPQVQRGWSSIRTEQTAFAVAQSLRAARALAITKNCVVDWTWDAGVGKASLSSQKTPTCSPDDLADRLTRFRPISKPIHVVVQQSPLSFFPNGTTSQTTTLLVSDADVPRHHITVDGPTGLVAVQAGAPPSAS